MQAETGVPVRWGGALAIVLALHGAAAWMLSSHGFPPMTMPAAPEAVLLDLAPDLPPVQPAEVPLPVPVVETPPPVVPPQPAEMPVAPIPVADTPPPPVAAEAVLPVPPPMPPPPPRAQPRPKVRVVERQAVPMERWAEAHPTDTQRADTQRAPQAMEPARPPAPASTAAPSWRSDLLARLQRAKRYPDLARSRGNQGVATVTFTMDRGGRVLDVNLVRSSSSALLDDEAVALVRRAEPLPQLPEEMPGRTITLTVPISFALR